MTDNVALIGAGVMGGAIGTRQLGAGNRLAIFDPDAAKAQVLADKGGIATSSAAGAAGQADFVILVAEYFDGRIHHHVTVANNYPL